MPARTTEPVLGTGSDSFPLPARQVERPLRSEGCRASGLSVRKSFSPAGAGADEYLSATSLRCDLLAEAPATHQGLGKSTCCPCVAAAVAWLGWS